MVASSVFFVFVKNVRRTRYAVARAVRRTGRTFYRLAGSSNSSLRNDRISKNRSEIAKRPAARLLRRATDAHIDRARVPHTPVSWFRVIVVLFRTLGTSKIPPFTKSDGEISK